MPVLERKPGALRNGAPFRELLDNLPQPLREFRHKLNSHKNADKEFIKILLYVANYGLSAVSNACAEVLKIGSCSINLVERHLSPPALVMEQVFEFVLRDAPNTDCTQYNDIYLRGENYGIN